MLQKLEKYFNWIKQYHVISGLVIGLIAAPICFVASYVFGNEQAEQLVLVFVSVGVLGFIVFLLTLISILFIVSLLLKTKFPRAVKLLHSWICELAYWKKQALGFLSVTFGFLIGAVLIEHNLYAGINLVTIQAGLYLIIFIIAVNTIYSSVISSNIHCK